MKPFQMAFGVLVQFSQKVALTELRHAYSCTWRGGGKTIACYKKDEYRGGVPRFCKTYCLCLTLYDGKKRAEISTKHDRWYGDQTTEMTENRCQLLCQTVSPTLQPAHQVGP